MPAELLLGRMGTAEFVQGVRVLSRFVLGLSAARVVTFRRGPRATRESACDRRAPPAPAHRAQFARVGVVRKSQFRVEFWFQVIMDCLWYATHVGVFEVLYMHVSEIAGWDRDEFRVLLGYLFVSDAFMMVWLGQIWRFGRDLKDGELDPFRVRPAATLFL